MKSGKQKIILGFSLAVLGLAVYGYLKAVPEGGESAPRIVIEPKAFDFGEVKRPAVVRHRFAVKNGGRETLEITRVSTSCGCTTAAVAAEKIGPGQRTTLVVTYDSGAMRGGNGRIERTVYVRSNDPERPQVEVVIAAEVK